ncbi:MAG TPA: 1,4-alpha-glucan branching enzyme, partial [Chloroflexia bacterium]|nr:1,4-alpha-glucan branching enzyme [Chloroflexia bacterium]
MAATLTGEEIEALVGGYHSDPFAVLGPHQSTVDGEPATAVRVFLPWARGVRVTRPDGPPQEMWRVHAAGVFEALLPGPRPPDYRLQATNPLGQM